MKRMIGKIGEIKKTGIRISAKAFIKMTKVKEVYPVTLDFYGGKIVGYAKKISYEKGKLFADIKLTKKNKFKK